MPANQACAVSDDSGLLKLEEQIFEQYEKATAYDDEIARVAEIWTAESTRLYQEALAAEIQEGVYLTPEERWKIVADLPECREHNRLESLQEPHYREMDRMIAQMWSTPAHTAEGRQAKVWVLLGCILGGSWRETDDRMEYEKQRARDLLGRVLVNPQCPVIRQQQRRSGYCTRSEKGQKRP
jgi:hypothetical protein